MSSAVTANLHAQELRGGFNLLHGSNAMAFVIMVGLLKRGVSLDQQTRRRWTGGNKTLAERERKADSGQTDDGTAKANSHIILTFVLLPDVPARSTVTHNNPTASCFFSSI